MTLDDAVMLEWRNWQTRQTHGTNIPTQNLVLARECGFKSHFQQMTAKPKWSQEQLAAAVADEISLNGVMRRLGVHRGQRYAVRVAIETANLNIDHFKIKPRISLAAMETTRQNEKDRRAQIERSQRASGSNLSGWILEDSRKADRRKGLENDLDREFIEHLLEIHPDCSYCGERTIRRTLDRVDNTKGHLKTNVRVACIRCNLLRHDMPFEAWMSLVPHIRTTREQGLFGTWIGKGLVGTGQRPKKVLKDEAPRPPDCAP